MAIEGESQAPLPAFIVENKVLMHYMELFPILLMYVVPTVMLGALVILIVHENMYASDKFLVRGKTVVITGGSQGMGRAAGKILAQKGANVVIVARDQKKLDAAKEDIAAAAKKPQSQKFLTISADLTKAAESTRIIREVTAWNNNRPPDVVWANAGGMTPYLFLDASSEQLMKEFELNYWAAAHLAQATLRAWLAPGPGATNEITKFDDGRPRRTKPDPRHFVMTSSCSAFVGLAGYTSYSPAKAALRSLHDNLRSEIQMYNGAHDGKMIPDVKIHTVFPGGIATPGYEAENRLKHVVTKMLEEDDPVQSEDKVAQVAIRELERGHSLITTQMIAKLMRASSMQGSKRDQWFFDTALSWVSGIVWLFVTPSMDKKIWAWGKKNGAPKHQQ